MNSLLKRATTDQIIQALCNIKASLYSYEIIGIYCLFDSQEQVAKSHHLKISTVKNYCYKTPQKTINKFLRELSSILEIKEPNKKYQEHCHYAYLMKNENGFYKVGKSKNPITRKAQLNNHSNFGSFYDILHTWEFFNAEDAYEMEIWLHRYFRKIGGELFGQDHFLKVYKKIDIDLLDEKAEEIKKNSKKWLDKII